LVCMEPVLANPSSYSFTLLIRMYVNVPPARKDAIAQHRLVAIEKIVTGVTGLVDIQKHYPPLGPCWGLYVTLFMKIQEQARIGSSMASLYRPETNCSAQVSGTWPRNRPGGHVPYTKGAGRLST